MYIYMVYVECRNIFLMLNEGVWEGNLRYLYGYVY